MKLPRLIFSKKYIFAFIIGVALLATFSAWQWQHPHTSRSPYAGQETRKIKALSQAEVTALRAGAGTPFGGMAKPAELNGYPGPRHVLDAYDAGEFSMTKAQHEKITALYEAMRTEAVALGTNIIEIEKEIDDAFADKTITADFLQEKVAESARRYGQLRVAHLKYHLSVSEILLPVQVRQYNALRRYATDNACENIPAGHDANMWKLHNNCL